MSFKKKNPERLHLLTLEFSKSNEGACEGDASDEGSQEEEGLDHVACGVRGEVWLLQHVVGEAGEDSRGSHQGVEQGHHLGQVCHLHTLGQHNRMIYLV